MKAHEVFVCVLGGFVFCAFLFFLGLIFGKAHQQEIAKQCELSGQFIYEETVYKCEVVK